MPLVMAVAQQSCVIIHFFCCCGGQAIGGRWRVEGAYSIAYIFMKNRIKKTMYINIKYYEFIKKCSYLAGLMLSCGCLFDEGD